MRIGIDNARSLRNVWRPRRHRARDLGSSTDSGTSAAEPTEQHSPKNRSGASILRLFLLMLREQKTHLMIEQRMPPESRKRGDHARIDVRGVTGRRKDAPRAVVR